MKTSEFVSQARDEIHMGGWTQGAYRNTEGVCVIGALDRVAMRNLQNGGIQAHKPAQAALLEKAREMFPGTIAHSIPGYNDASGRTKQDTLDMFDKTIIGLEERGL